MQSSFSRSTVLTLALLAMLPLTGAAQEPATAPATAPTSAPALTLHDISRKMQEFDRQLSQIITGPDIFADPAKRKDIAPQVVPILKQMLATLDLAAEQKLIRKEVADENGVQLLTLLTVFGETSAADRLQADAASKDGPTSLRAQSGQLMARWLGAGKNADEQSKILIDLTKLDTAHPEEVGLTMLTMEMSQGAATPELKKQMQKLITDGMKNPAVDQLKEQFADEAKLQAMENQPLTIKGVMPDGKEFSTEPWKGKVVLVDFWATWCGPCVRELPRVKKLYDQYHDKGLEILGVSNDYEAQKLTDFTKKENMPWPQLLDTKAAADQQWNPITVGFGIRGIPTMFIVDKKGVLRSVSARETMEELVPKLLAE